MKNIYLEIEAANIVLGLTITDTLPNVAERALMDGYDSPSLRILAGLTKSEVTEEAIPYFKKALSELGVSLPLKRDAVLLLANQVAKQILQGNIKPYEGAKKIWKLELILESNQDFHDLDPFIYTASEWEDRP